tara:strand:- start:6032 stop:8152 length:2121 start_codon:yes stop_codon:yes gene_type:complete
MFGEIRKILADKYYNDLDIKNCHPVIIYNLCLKHNIKCSNLKKFIETREDILKVIVENNPEGHMNQDRIEGESMTRDVAKRFLLTLFFGASLDNQKKAFNIECLEQWIEEDFFDELTNIINTIYKLNCYKNIRKHVEDKKKLEGKTDNLRGCIFSKIIQDFERQLIDILTYDMEIKGYKIGTYMYDGLFIEKTKEIVKDDIDFFSKKLTDFFNIENPMPIELIIKPMGDYNNRYLEIIKDYKKYLVLKDRFENKEKVFKIMKPLSYCNSRLNEATGNFKIDLIDRKKLIDTYENFGAVSVNWSKNQTDPFTTAWLKDKYCKTYDAMVFEPKKDFNDPKILNQFKGFEIEKYKYDDLPTTQEGRKEYCKTLFDFISKISCNDKSSIDYFTNWISISLKCPNKKIEAMPIFKGLKGTGKTTLFSLIQSIIGLSYCAEITDMKEDLFGKHSLSRVNTLLILVDEIDAKRFKEHEDQMKTAITSDTMIINPKGLQPYRYNSYEKYIGNTNKNIPVYLDDNNRRIRIFDCDKVNYGSIEEKEIYFNNLYKIIGDRNNKPNHKMLKCFYEYMCNFDSEKYNFGANVNNEATMDIVDFNKDISYNFLQDYLYILRTNQTVKDFNDTVILNVSLAKLFIDFNSYKTKNKINMDISSNLFSRKLNSYSFIAKTRTTKGINYSIDMVKYKAFFNWQDAIEIDMDESQEIEEDDIEE